MSRNVLKNRKHSKPSSNWDGSWGATGGNKIKLLISPATVEEACGIRAAGADIIDVKNPAEGSLGAGFPWTIRNVIKAARGASVSAAIGDIFDKPGSFSLAAYAAASLGADYVKAGFFGFSDWKLAAETAACLKKAVKMASKRAKFVMAGYADWKRFGGLSCEDILRAAARAGADVVMLDTYVKDGRSLFDAVPLPRLTRFMESARSSRLETALAGSLRPEHAPLLRRLAPDIVGTRGGVCRNFDRKLSIDPRRVKAFKEALSAPVTDKRG